MGVRTICVVLLTAAFLVLNLGFGLQFCEAGPYDPWSWGIFMQQTNPGGMSWGGAPMRGSGFNNYGYNYFSPNSGPSWPLGGVPQSSLGYYNYTWGPPTSPLYPSGGDGISYGGWPGQDYYRPGATGLFGLYGYGNPTGFYGAGN